MSSVSVAGWFKIGETISNGSKPIEWTLVQKGGDSYSAYVSQSSSRLYFFSVAQH